jgi:predicted ArsR family transcriptional regulator
MDSQTYSLFEGLGSRVARESLELLLALLEEEGSVEELCARTGISSSTASRRLDELALAGLVSRGRARGPYELSCPEPTRLFLESASDLASAILDARKSGEEQFKKRLRKTRLRPAASAENASESA